jgi:tRNA dimethylallyltransferase
LIRAIEVYRATGEPISHQQLQFEEGHSAEQCRVFVLRRPRVEQNARIDERVEEMLDRGLVDEVRELTADGRQLGRTASQAVGYREVIDHLAGQIDFASMVERIKTRTRQFAKRQGTWFRSLSECRFVDIEGEADAEKLAKEIVAAGHRIA